MIEIVEGLVFLVFVVGGPIYARIGWPAFVREARLGVAGIRVRAYRQVIAVQWAATAVLLICWAVRGRPWSALGLGPPGAWAWVGLGAVAILGVLATIQVRRIAAKREENAEDIRRQFGDTILFLPHDRTELRWFAGLAMTASFCEEVIYRGALPIFLTAWLPAAWAIIAATLAFAVGHGYQGTRALLKVAIGGALLAIIAWVTDSLWVVIALHAVVDLQGGAVAYIVCTDPARTER